MSFGGLKKQMNKTRQYLGEKVVGNKGTEVDNEIIELGRKLDVVNESVEEMKSKTKEYLQPNPATSTKMAMQSSYQKARGQISTAKYTQPEYNLADVFTKYGAGLSDKSPHTQSLLEVGESFKALSEAKDEMEACVLREFLDPLDDLQHKDLKEISHHRKKLNGRRLDYDYKRNKGDKVTSEELKLAKDKFVESQDLCYNSMREFLQNGEYHIKLLHDFTEAIKDYHKQWFDIMASISDRLNEKLNDVGGDIDSTYTSMSELTYDSRYDDADTTSTIMETPTTPCCRALYDFEYQNDGDLELSVGDVIEIKSRIDDNWLSGSCNGRTGIFPQSHVEIIVPLLL